MPMRMVDAGLRGWIHLVAQRILPRLFTCLPLIVSTNQKMP